MPTGTQAVMRRKKNDITRFQFFVFVLINIIYLYGSMNY